MGKFSKYSGLFAEQGGFDIPSKYGVGIAFKATPETTVAFDVERINYADVPSVGNTFPACAAQLGADNGGPGFGWQNINAYKLGVSHAYSSTFTLRAGYDSLRPADTEQPDPVEYPGAGRGARPSDIGRDLDIGRQVRDIGSLCSRVQEDRQWFRIHPSRLPPGGLGGGNANLTMHEDSIGISYGW